MKERVRNDLAAAPKTKRAENLLATCAVHGQHSEWWKHGKDLICKRCQPNPLAFVSDHELNLPDRWFTGKEWADGTAQRVIAEDYRTALIEAGYEPLEEQTKLLP